MLGIFLDTETNGLNPFKHKILELAFLITDMQTGEVKGSYESIIHQQELSWSDSDPVSLQINGLTLNQVKSGKPISQVSDEILNLFSKLEIKRGKAVFICQNPSFDRAFFAQIIDPEFQEKLLWPYHWLDLASMHWSRSILLQKTFSTLYPWETGVSKDSIAKTYQIPPENKPHRAMNGVKHLILCYEAVVGFPEK